MTPQRYAIADNVRLSYIQTDKFKAETLTVSFDIPLTHENYVLSHLLCQLLGRGCERLPSLELINRELDELYSSSLCFNTTARADTLSVCMSAEMISNRFISDGTDVLGGVLRAGADMLLRPLTRDGIFIPETVSKVSAAFVDQIKAIKSHPRAYALARLSELMDRNTRRSVTLDYILESTPKVNALGLYSFYKYLLSSSSISVFYVGSTSPDAVADAFSAAFGSIVGVRPMRKLPDISTPEEYISVTEDMPIKQGNLALGFRTGAGLSNNDHPTLFVLNEILGGSPASKLFLNVRERMSLCYYCSSKASLITGSIVVSSGLDNTNKELAKSEIFRQLELIAKGEISNEELCAARGSIKYSYSQIYDSARALRSFYTERDCFGIEETVEQYKQRLLSVSAEDVSRLAAATVHDTEFFIRGVGAESDGDDYE